MTIYFVGSTVADFDESFGSVGNYDDDTAGFISTSNSGGGSLLKNLDTIVTGVLFMSYTFVRFSISTSLADFSLSNDPGNSSISFWDGEGNNIFFGGFNPNSGNFEGRVQLRDGSSEDLTIFSNSLMDNGVKLTVRIEPGVGMTFYANGSQQYVYTGNVGNSLSSVNGVGKVGVGNGDAQGFPDFKDILVADFDTRFADVDLVTVNTTASTDTSSTGDSTVIPSIIQGFDRTQYIGSNALGFDADGEKVIYPENDTITIADGKAIVGVVMSYAGFETGAAPVTNLTPILVISSTEYTGNTIPLGTSTTYAQRVFSTNPATSAAWTESDLEGIGYGFSLNT